MLRLQIIALFTQGDCGQWEEIVVQNKSGSTPGVDLGILSIGVAPNLKTPPVPMKLILMKETRVLRGFN